MSKSAFKMLTGKPTGKKVSGRPSRRWEDNITMDLKEMGINTRNWVDSAQETRPDQTSSLRAESARVSVQSTFLCLVSNPALEEHR